MKKQVFLLLLSCWLSNSALSMESVDTAIFLDQTYGNSIYWLDNDNLVVAGVPSDRSASYPKGWRLLKYSLTDRKTTDLGVFGGGLCVSGNFIRYWRPTPDTVGKPLSAQKRVSVAGPIEHLVEVSPPPPLLPGQEPFGLSPLQGCQFPHEQPAPPLWLESAKKSGRQFRALKPEHGWLETGYAGAFDSHHQRTYPLAIHPPGLEDKPYPIDQGQFRPWFEKAYSLTLLRYEPFKNAYLLAAPNGTDGRNEGALWWLYPDGRLEAFLGFTQQGEWSGVSYRNLIPTAQDMLIVATKTPSRQNWGLYRRTADNRLELVVEGWAEGGGKAVSPDGCKVAFGIDPRGYPNSRYQLQVVNVCERNPKSQN